MVYIDRNCYFSKFTLNIFCCPTYTRDNGIRFGESGVIIIATVVGTLGDGPSVPFHIHSDLSNLNWAQFV